MNPDTRGRTSGSQASIEYISPRVDDSTGTVAMRAVLDNGGGGRLLAGRVVRARIAGVSMPGSFVIPKRALMHSAQGPFVWVIGRGEQVAATPVQLGPSSGNNVVVASGLTAATASSSTRHPQGSAWRSGARRDAQRRWRTGESPEWERASAPRMEATGDRAG
jgi:multidrug efflux pump subunit AcrA (membrane-fusion protein)